jgi:hypothetical protein
MWHAVMHASGSLRMTSSFEPVRRLPSLANVSHTVGAVQVQPNALAQFRDHLLHQARVGARRAGLERRHTRRRSR